MKGLLLKDLYMIRKYLRTWVVMMVAFVVLGALNSETMFFVFYPCMISGMIPVSLLGYDERSKWDVYAGTLPCTRAQFVSAKYLIGLSALAIVVVLTGITQAARMISTASFNWDDYGVMMGMLVMLGCISSAMTLPVMFKLGVEKGRMAYYVMVGVVCGASAMMPRILDSQLQMPVSLNAGLPVAVAVVVGLYALSWYLSIRFYEKREMK